MTYFTMDNQWVGIDTKLGVSNFRISIPQIKIMYIGHKIFYNMPLLDKRDNLLVKISVINVNEVVEF